MSEPIRTTALLRGISQFQVDFVIPRVGIDLPIGIDPFLLFKSWDPELRSLHDLILNTFNKGIGYIRENQRDKVRYLFDFPEAFEIGLGYTSKSKRGAGIGNFLSELIIETFTNSPLLLERGVKHIEEMQLVSFGIGPDRISDISANIIKQYLIEYTQKQCQLWKIPLIRDVPISHIFDSEDCTWFDGYFDLPISPIDQLPILLVPRRIVRTLPWINYDDFFRMEFSAYLTAKKVRGQLKSLSKKKSIPEIPRITDKEQVIKISRMEVERVDRYVKAKEDAAANAQPSLSYLDQQYFCPEAQGLKEKLLGIIPGAEQAGEFQKLILKILNFLFSPELIDGELEVETFDGTERRDIIFTNDSDETFWDYIRKEHSSIFLMFETKNVAKVDNNHLNQTATYLGDRLGFLGFIVTRNPLEVAQERKALSIYNDSHPRKIILAISDKDIYRMLDLKCRQENPMRHIQKLYREFRTKAQ